MMRFVLFYHSLLSDWNHGNAHFLRGMVTELLSRGHHVTVYEPRGGWSLTHLLRDHGIAPLADFHRAYPHLSSCQYDIDRLDLDQVTDQADVVIVHEWNDPALICRLADHRRRLGGYHLLFHDTHHRCVSQPDQLAACDLASYDGVLAFGRVIERIYRQRQWVRTAWVLHEAADTRIFQPRRSADPPRGDLVWIGNWGDDERTAELETYLLKPVRDLRLTATVYGVRYPAHALKALGRAGIHYGGWLANHRVASVFGQYRVTVHVPRRFYVDHLPGVPTIRVFEALACGIPLVSAPWQDAEQLFTPGKDYVLAEDGRDMTRQLRRLLDDSRAAGALAAHGCQTIRHRHTCSHRADELLAIIDRLDRQPGSRDNNASFNTTTGNVLTQQTGFHA